MTTPGDFTFESAYRGEVPSLGTRAKSHPASSGWRLGPHAIRVGSISPQ